MTFSKCQNYRSGELLVVAKGEVELGKKEGECIYTHGKITQEPTQATGHTGEMGTEVDGRDVSCLPDPALQLYKLSPLGDTGKGYRRSLHFFLQLHVVTTTTSKMTLKSCS